MISLHASDAVANDVTRQAGSEQKAAQLTGIVLAEEFTVATAFVRAMNADPMCSFGDFVAISHGANFQTTNILIVEVGDGIGAPSLEPEALGFLRAKKQGKFIVI